MEQRIGEFIEFVLSNFTLTFLVIGFLHTAVRLVRARRPLKREAIVEAFFVPYLLYSIGLSFLYNFVMHVFFGEMSARFIGWAPSPFQPEVGFASLGFAVVGLLAIRGGYGMRVAAVAGPACFLLGAAAGHVMQMVHAHNFAPGNAGVIFYTDIAIPLFGFVLLRGAAADAADAANAKCKMQNAKGEERNREGETRKANAECRMQNAECRMQNEEGEKRQGEGRRQNAKGKRQKAKGRRQRQKS